LANVLRISTTAPAERAGRATSNDKAADDAVFMEQRDREHGARPRLEQRAT
jgi:hypothetical protein